MRDFQQIQWDEVVADDFRQMVRLAVREELERGQELTTQSLVPSDATAAARIVARGPGVICGLRAAEIVCEQMDARLQLNIQSEDGVAVESGHVVAVLSGPARSMLTAERPLLNFVGRLSGVATLTRKYVEQAQGTKARIYDTRKTTPGWRRLEKYAVRTGGGHNHRTGLYDAVLIKDNHLAFGVRGSQGSRFTIADAVLQAREFLNQMPEGNALRDAIVEVEVDSIDQFKSVLPVAPDIVLLDNMTPEQLRQCVAIRDEAHSLAELEASGGVHLQTVRAIAATGVDRISAGALTHSAMGFDVGLDWDG
jgi:nicotinate-nucleotide pyrophosphorylase (carboxylating)